VADHDTPQAGDSSPRLPIHLPTVARNLWRRRAVPIVFACAGVAAGVVVALAFGSRSFRAETVLLYRPTLVGLQDAPSVLTQQQLVKVQTTLDETRRRLGWQVSLPALASAIDVSVQKNTDLLFIRAAARSPASAAVLANTTRDVFLEQQGNIRRGDATTQVAEVERRLTNVTGALQKADAALAAFTQKHGIVDLDRTTGAYLQQAMSVDVLYQQALADRDAIEQQNTNIGRATSDLKRKVAKEQKDAGASEDLTSLNIRIGRLRSAIEEDRRSRAGQALLEQRAADLTRAQRLRDEGLMSRAEFDKINADYEWQKAQSIDTEQIGQWKDELKRLDTGVIPKSSSDTATTPILRDVMLRALDLDLEKGGIGERVRRLDQARAEIKSRIDTLPALQKDYVALKREVDARETERRSLDDLLGRLRSAGEARTSDFSIISVALPPAFPAGSSRRPLFITTVVLFLAAGLVLIVVAELRDRTFRSSGDIAAFLGELPELVLPGLPAHVAQPPGAASASLVERFRRLAWRLRQGQAGRGLRLMVVSATAGEGTTLVASHLAAAFGRLDQRVLLVDAHVRLRQPEGLHGVALSNDPLDGGRLLPSHIENRMAAAVRAGGDRVAGTIPAALRQRALMLKAPVLTVARYFATARRWFAAVLTPGSGFQGAAPLSLNGLILVPAGAGLGGYLSYDAVGLDDLTVATTMPGVECVPSSEPAVVPDLLGSDRYRSLVGSATARFDIVVIDAPPVLESVDAEILARSSDAVVVVVRASHATASEVKDAMKRLQETGVRIAAVVLNGVDKLHLAPEGRS
jgi:Mrp family chromosome partitioning ATPase/uncharacterized protein involved in exopolysaccharide biosynthesis